MADSTIDSQLIHLVNNWGTFPEDFDNVPRDGFVGADHHNVATAEYAIGFTKQVRCDGSVGIAGLSTFIYLQVGTQDTGTALAAKSIVTRDSASLYYSVSNDAATAVKVPTGLVAIALSAMTDGNWGWFWCGGVCPEQYVSGLGGAYLTEGNVVAGEINADAGVTATTILAFSPVLTVTTTAFEGVCGYALA